MIIIRRRTGGLGDQCLHRYIFQDIAEHYAQPVYFQTPKQYHPVHEGHPYLAGCIDINTPTTEGAKIYDTTSPCIDSEDTAVDEGRPDTIEDRPTVWARAAGVQLRTEPRSFLTVNPSAGRRRLRAIGARPRQKTILFAPFSADPARTLRPAVIADTIAALQHRGHFVFVVHDRPTYRLNAPIITDASILDLFSITASASIILSTDTSLFHIAGSMDSPRKKVVGIFQHIDGMNRAKYYDAVVVQPMPSKACPCWRHHLCPISRAEYKPCNTMLTVADVMKGIDACM